MNLRLKEKEYKVLKLMVDNQILRIRNLTGDVPKIYLDIQRKMR